MPQEPEFSGQNLAFTFRPPEIQGASKCPIVVLHGLLGSHKNFTGFNKAFSAMGYPVLCLDARNHGASFHADTFDYPVMARDLERLLCDLDQQQYGGTDWSRVAVLGHSMGGRTAFMHALLYPARVAALVAVDVVPSPENPDIGILRIVEAMQVAEKRLSQAAGRKEAEEILRCELSTRGVNSEAVLQFLLLCNLRGTSGSYHWACNLASIERNLEQIVRWPTHQTETLCNPNLPLLLIAGGRSPYVGQQGWELLLQYFPHSQETPTVKEVIEDAYHWPHSETPQEFRTLVAEFLSEIGQ
ncbi:alpha/beta fold hydrolase [Candidatus Haliotispira prima]|uniref:Alpha/beta fold hydrolase n=1 Tax=Candidatus Haliotispira prima TaxID=3034016 RepID=A0ABY8MK41_9SPIO|nr:alpha/beta fold hydrolase [Candidatus Haliotispira prima]